MHLRYPIKQSNECLKNWICLTLSHFVLKKSHTRRQRRRSGSGNMNRYQILLLSNLIEELIFVCNINPDHSVSSFIAALEGFASQMNLKFSDTETSMKIKMCILLEHLNQRHNRTEEVMDFVDDCIVDFD